MLLSLPQISTSGYHSVMTSSLNILLTGSFGIEDLCTTPYQVGHMPQHAHCTLGVLWRQAVTM